MNGNAAIVSYSVQVSNIFFRYDVTTALSTGGFGCGFNTGDYNTGIITTQDKSKRDGRKRRGLNESFLHFHYVFFSIKIQILPMLNSSFFSTDMVIFDFANNKLTDSFSYGTVDPSTDTTSNIV